MVYGTKLQNAYYGGPNEVRIESTSNASAILVVVKPSEVCAWLSSATPRNTKQAMVLVNATFAVMRMECHAEVADGSNITAKFGTNIRTAVLYLQFSM